MKAAIVPFLRVYPINWNSPLRFSVDFIPHACARGKAIGFVCLLSVISSTPDLDIQASEQLVGIRNKSNFLKCTSNPLAQSMSVTNTCSIFFLLLLAIVAMPIDCAHYRHVHNLPGRDCQMYVLQSSGHDHGCSSAVQIQSACGVCAL